MSDNSNPRATPMSSRQPATAAPLARNSRRPQQQESV
jgi:hypothetical protein